MSYLTQIERAIDYVEAHLMDSLAVEDIAREAGLSRWHFQRIFTATLGETVTSYIEARRLSHAAMRLVTTTDRIIDIAFDLDYGSHEVFTRAFKRSFGMSPAAFRRCADASASIPQKPRVTTDYLKHLDRGITMKPEIKICDAFSAVGLAGSFVPIDQPDLDNMAVIPGLWRTLRARSAALPPEALGLRVGVIGAQAAEAGKMDYLAGRVLKDGVVAPSGFDVRHIPAGAFAVFTHKGPAAQVGHTLNYIFGAWLPRSGKVLREGAEFELYPEGYDPTAADAEVDLYIPVE